MSGLNRIAKRTMSTFLQRYSLHHPAPGRQSFACWLAVTLAVGTMGCGFELPALKPPAFDPSTASQAAMDQFDTNADGKLDKGELKSAPSLQFSLDRIDADGDGAITQDELSTMIQEKWIDAGAGIMLIGAQVTLNRKPLDGATITFEPEPFLGEVLHPASGETDFDGFASMSMAPEHMPHENVRAGVSPGLYLVRISKIVNDKELVPAKYNTETTLGVEVAARASYMPGPVHFELRK